MSGDGYQMDPGCVQAIEKLREVTPKTVGEVRQYIKNFARTAKPIYDLLAATGKDGQPPSDSNPLGKGTATSPRGVGRTPQQSTCYGIPRFLKGIYSPHRWKQRQSWGCAVSKSRWSHGSHCLCFTGTVTN